MWGDILRKKTSRISIYAKRLADEVIDETPRSINEILDLMFNKVEERRKIKSGPNKRPGTGSRVIPTRNELIKYLSVNYNSILVDKITGKEITTGRRTLHRETRYFR
jgi:hypothetical protein